MSNEDKIEWKKCNKCGFLQYPTHLRCLKCRSKDFIPTETSGACKLLSYTILNAPPAEFRDRENLILGIVEFENGIRALGQLTSKENLANYSLVNKQESNIDGIPTERYTFAKDNVEVSKSEDNVGSQLAIVRTFFNPSSDPTESGYSLAKEYPVRSIPAIVVSTAGAVLSNLEMTTAFWDPTLSSDVEKTIVPFKIELNNFML